MDTTPIPVLTPSALLEAFSIVSSATPAPADPSTIALASSFLTTHSKTSPDFLPLLLDLLAEHASAHIPDVVRLQAAVQLKRGIERWWRAHSSTVASPEIKQRTREVLLEVVKRGEADGRLRRVAAVCVGKIASIDTEDGWPNLIPTLMQSITSALTSSTPSPFSSHGFAILQSLLLSLNRIVSESSHLRTARQRLLFSRLSERWFPQVHDLHGRCFASWTERLRGDGGTELARALMHGEKGEEAWVDLEMSRVTLKILTRMALADCFREPVEHPEIKNFMLSSIEHFKSIFNLRSHLISTLFSSAYPSDPPFFTSTSLLAFFVTINKHLARYGKFVHDALEKTSTPPPVQRIPGWTHAVVGAWGDMLRGSWEVAPSKSSFREQQGDSELAMFPDRLVIRSISILRDITTSWACSHTSSSPSASPSRQIFTQAWHDPDLPPSSPSSPPPMSEEEALWQANALSPSLIARFARGLVTKCLRLRPLDIARWLEDPEAYDAEFQAPEQRVEYDLRGAAERWFADLAASWPDAVDTVVEELWAHAVDGVRVPESEEMWSEEGVGKEAVYTAVGLGSRGTRERIEVERVIDEVFAPEAMSKAGSTRILRRRISWLLGVFAGGDISSQARIKIYSLLTTLLSTRSSTSDAVDPDLAVQLAAARSLSSLGSWSSLLAVGGPSAYRPYLPLCISEVSYLLAVVETVETQSALTKILGDLIEAMGEEIVSVAGQLMATLEGLWNALGESQLGGAVLTTTLKLVDALGPASQDLHPAACALVGHVLDPPPPTTAAAADLLEVLEPDAIQLLLGLLRQATALSPTLLALLPPALNRLLPPGRASNCAGLSILREYTLLEPSCVTSEAAISIVGEALARLIRGDQDLDGIKATMATVVRIVKAAEAAQWGRLLHASGCFGAMLAEVLSTRTYMLNRTKYLVALCQLVVTGPEVFVQLVAASAAQLHKTPGQAIDEFRIQCIDMFDYLGGSAQDGKTVATALAFLVARPPSIHPELLTQIVSHWCTQLSIGDEEPDGEDTPWSEEAMPSITGTVQTWHYPSDQDDGDEFDAIVEARAHRQRLQRLRTRDLLYTQRQRDILNAQLAEAHRLGGPEFVQAWAAVDPLQLDELQRRLQGSLRG